MDARKRISLGIAAWALGGFFTSNVLAQMPGNQLSPWNQLGRAWGIGIGDGYNECVNCPKERSKGYGINAFKTSGDKVNAPDQVGSSAWYTKLNPFSNGHSESACGVPGCNVCVQGTPASHVVLPPSGASYQHFATPAETPLPWSSAPQTHYQPSTIPHYGMPPTQQYQPEAPRAVPDPVPQQRSDWNPQPPTSVYPNSQTYRNEPTPANRQPIAPRFDDREVIEPQRMPDSTSDNIGKEPPSNPPAYERPSASPTDDLLGTDYLLDAADVPLPPALRRRQPQDKPLGEFPSDALQQQQRREPPRARESDDSDSLLPMEDESFDLVPGNDLPPVTQRRIMPTKQSTRAIPASVSRSWNKRIHPNMQVDEQMYSDDGYSRRRPVGAITTQPTMYQSDQSTNNRYR